MISWVVAIASLAFQNALQQINERCDVPIIQDSSLLFILHLKQNKCCLPHCFSASCLTLNAIIPEIKTFLSEEKQCAASKYGKRAARRHTTKQRLQVNLHNLKLSLRLEE
uniref:Secreted protein n=1 Tax=Loa loa TaxID=7209 RepID=A0A1I7VDU3_LOALO